jgi:hypothetical protein
VVMNDSRPWKISLGLGNSTLYFLLSTLYSLREWRITDLNRIISANEITGFLRGFRKIVSRRGTPGARAAQLPNNKATKNDLLTTAQQSIHASRLAIAKLIDAMPAEDQYTLGKLGPILSELRAAESILDAIEAPYNA